MAQHLGWLLLARSRAVIRNVPRLQLLRGHAAAEYHCLSAFNFFWIRPVYMLCPYKPVYSRSHISASFARMHAGQLECGFETMQKYKARAHTAHQCAMVRPSINFSGQRTSLSSNETVPCERLCGPVRRTGAGPASTTGLPRHSCPLQSARAD